MENNCYFVSMFVEKYLKYIFTNRESSILFYTFNCISETSFVL